MTNDEARKLCPRSCLDCCCQEHHWGFYGGPDDANGDGEFEDDGSMECKHCPAKLDLEERCLKCGQPFIEHDIEGDWSCAEGFQSGTFQYKDQPVRVCNAIHPWDEGPTADDERGEAEAAEQESQRHEYPVLGCDCHDCIR